MAPDYSTLKMNITMNTILTGKTTREHQDMAFKKPHNPLTLAWQ